LFNWVVIALMSAAFGLGIVLSGFTVELSGLFSLGFVAVDAGFAHANARAQERRDPQVMFVLGGTAVISAKRSHLPPPPRNDLVFALLMPARAPVSRGLVCRSVCAAYATGRGSR
jgi:hypothetical protein